MIKRTKLTFEEMMSLVPHDVRLEGNWGFAISDRIHELMTQRGLSKAEFAKAIGTSPYAVAMWISGQYNFSLRTLARISTFFGEPLIHVVQATPEAEKAQTAAVQCHVEQNRPKTRLNT